MGLLKRTFSLPASTLEEFEREVPPGRRSPILSEVLRAWLEQHRKDRLRREVIEGCREMAELYLEIEREFHPLEEEVQRGLEASSQARRHRARPSRSGRRV